MVYIKQYETLTEIKLNNEDRVQDKNRLIIIIFPVSFEFLYSLSYVVDYLKKFKMASMNIIVFINK